jgi:hypothetical protein
MDTCCITSKNLTLPSTNENIVDVFAW